MPGWHVSSLPVQNLTYPRSPAQARMWVAGAQPCWQDRAILVTTTLNSSQHHSAGATPENPILACIRGRGRDVSITHSLLRSHLEFWSSSGLHNPQTEWRGPQGRPWRCSKGWRTLWGKTKGVRPLLPREEMAEQGPHHNIPVLNGLQRG